MRRGVKVSRPHPNGGSGCETGPVREEHVACYWEQPELWGDELNELDTVRIPSTIATIPEGVRSILDIGCGNGRLSNRLAGRYEVIGLDISRTALSRASVQKVVGSSAQLPLHDGSVDLVLCTDLLEHLPERALRETVREMARVSGRYVLVGVPFKERFEAGYAKCNACRHVFNGFGHLRTFDCRTLDRLFPGCEVTDTAFVGGRRQYYNRVLLWIQQRVGGAYWGAGEKPVCPACGNTNIAPPRRHFLQRVVSRLCHLAKEALDRQIPDRWKPQNEVIRLYRKTGQPPGA